MKRILSALLTFCVFYNAHAQLTPFEKSTDRNYTATYPEIIGYYHKLAAHYPQMRLFNYGTTDMPSSKNKISAYCSLIMASTPVSRRVLMPA